MTKYLDPSFSVNLGGKAFSEGWDRIFGTTPREPASLETSDIRKQVEEFRIAMGQPRPQSPEIPTNHRLKFCLGLIAEEFVELLEASCGTEYAYTDNASGEYVDDWLQNIIHDGEYRNVDLVEIADALADLDYVIEGLRLELGINGKPIANEVHRSNMAKVGGEIREDGKRLKPKGWTPPDIETELKKQGWDPCA